MDEGHVMADHVHMLVSIPPKLAVSSVVGYLKGNSAMHVARHFLKRERNYAGQHLWARGYFVDTVGRDTEKIRRYIQAPALPEVPDSEPETSALSALINQIDTQEDFSPNSRQRPPESVAYNDG
jgi:hypothetical protein